MSSINSLNSLDSISDSDNFVVYSTKNADARKISAFNLSEYLQSKITSIDDKITQYYAPSTFGFNFQIVDSTESVWAIMTPSGDLSSGTITLPNSLKCKDKQEILIICTKAITSLIVDGNGSSVIGAPTSLTANQSFRLRFDGVTKTWYNII